MKNCYLPSIVESENTWDGINKIINESIMFDL